ncbi:MAG: bifunctional chorismate mutase/prephenate dehydratase [candidate division WOR-3 bacterium]|nr:bifunctional chorismate mutase/prephenate dehydratase [candidate division WOR-3 bacterium]
MSSSVRVYFQGTKGAYSELAAEVFFGRMIEGIGLPKFEDLPGALDKDHQAYAILPIENSLMGSIHRNYDLLLISDVGIVGEVELRITYNLFGLDAKNEIKEIWAHPAVLEQCREFITKHPDYKVMSFFDSAGAAEIIVKNNRRDIGIIAGPKVASIYGLETLVEGIEDNPMNFTRFLVLSKKKDIYREPDAKSSLVFGVKNEPGILFRCLSIFALRNIDLMKLESRPIIGKPWEYIFYIDFRGSIAEERCRKAVEILEEISVYFKFFGSYRVIKEHNYESQSKKM